MRIQRFLGFGAAIVLLALAGCGEDEASRKATGTDDEGTDPTGSAGLGIITVPFGPTVTEVTQLGTLKVLSPRDLVTSIGSYAVGYSGASSGTQVFNNSVNGGLKLTFNLPRGRYDFTLAGYATQDMGDPLIARANDVKDAVTGVEIDPEKGFILEPQPNVIDRYGSTVWGHFEWDIMYKTPDVEPLSVSYQNLDGTQAEAVTLDGLRSGGPTYLRSGKYQIMISTNKGNYLMVAHIYAGLTTRLILDATTIEVDRLIKEEVSVEIVNELSILTRTGSVFSASQTTITDPAWSVDTIKVATAAEGVSNNGYSLDYNKAADALDLDYGPVHIVAFLGKLKGKEEQGVWISESKQIILVRSSAIYYVNPGANSDYKSGATPEKAFRTLQAALDATFLGNTKEIRVIGDLKIDGTQQQSLNGAEGNNLNKKTTVTRIDGQEKGAVITVTGGTVSFHNITIDGRYSDSLYHRGLLVTGAGTVVALEGGTTIIGKSRDNGGGISVEAGATLRMRNGSVVKDSYATSGGGVFLQGGSTLEMIGNANISGNESAGNGGGISIQGGTVRMTNGTPEISSNKAAGNGGGVYVSNSATSIFNLTSGIVNGATGMVQAMSNTAARGAALYKEPNGVATVRGTPTDLIVDSTLQ
jgi:hypothetical protein